ncbi:hypothetical protein ACQKND_16335 [Viridibacillus arvi]|uniref:hypothetical protein n=1 Tax=Viridibacillus arvi TaxID=263475 RepID=UPI003CFE2793
MGTLRSNSTMSQKVKDKTKALYSELLDLEEEYAMELIDWYLEKTKTNKVHIKEMELRKQLRALKGKEDATSIEERKNIYAEIKSLLPINHPDNIKKGDVIYVNFGKGYSGEISDGHYGVVIKRKGNNYLIAPITKSFQPDRSNTKKLEKLGLPGKNGTVEICYINYGQVKFVDYRRLERIKGLRNQVNIAEELPDILTKFNNIIKE